jgi:hypothetical protein
MRPRAGCTLTERLIVPALAAPSSHAALQRQRVAAGAQEPARCWQ